MSLYLKTLIRGQTASIGVSFHRSVSFPAAPTWQFTDWNDELLSSGVATSAMNGSRWEASLTVPKMLVVPGGLQDCTLTFSGVDSRNIRREKSISISVSDATEQWQDFGLLVETGSTTIEDVIILPVSSPTSLRLSLREAIGDTISIVDSIVLSPVPTYDFVTSKGYAFRVALPLSKPLTTNSSANRFPYQFVVESTMLSQPAVKYTKPVYVLTPTITNYITDMRRYLDKARLDEIDPTLQFFDEELIHFLLRGVSFINGIGEPTFWTVTDLPPNLSSHLFTAACWEALNARYLAESANSFELQGANTSLSYSARKDGIQVKMDELRGVLDQYLPNAKQASIRRFGPGQVPAGTSTPNEPLGILHIAVSPVLNRPHWSTLRPEPTPGNPMSRFKF